MSHRLLREEEICNGSKIVSIKVDAVVSAVSEVPFQIDEAKVALDQTKNNPKVMFILRAI
ncbi:hypothetical protein V1477_018730 [Vespula maculifrons]|uniref:Uncharacterized protein n=1 Tax=Vespula maculifrons TaxID=7453 RepID=A0ABD2AW73_VESMC